MPIIFFDLETTDANPIGQILNYCFVKTDSAFEMLDEICGRIRISRLQLPRPEAILVNRVNVQEHQAEAALTEAEAMRQIAGFISGAIIESQEPVILAGFNSSQFDIGYLRTSLIRNGLNPYFQGKLQYRDLLLAARRLACTEPAFPRMAKPGGETEKLSLTLENLARQFGLLDQQQSHFSRDDVLLTIALARIFKARFGLNLAHFEAYELKDRDHEPLHGAVVYNLQPNYDLSKPDRAVTRPVTLLDWNHRSALFVDLEAYERGEGRRAIIWVNKGSGSFFREPGPAVAPALQALAARALDEFKAVKVTNFFPPSSCDIEQDIYRLDFDAIRALEEAIWRGQEQGVRKHPSREVRVVHTRWKLANHRWGAGDDRRVEELLKGYALYRYGGKAQLCKSLENEGVREAFHPTFSELLGEIKRRREQCGEAKDAELLDALHHFYLQSDICRVAGRELSAAPPAPAAAQALEV